jgi:hypothetical protein
MLGRWRKLGEVLPESTILHVTRRIVLSTRLSDDVKGKKTMTRAMCRFPVRLIRVLNAYKTGGESQPPAVR